MSPFLPCPLSPHLSLLLACKSCISVTVDCKKTYSNLIPAHEYMHAYKNPWAEGGIEASEVMVCRCCCKNGGGYVMRLAVGMAGGKMRSILMLKVRHRNWTTESLAEA